jgi:hypothetical protein
MVTFGRAKGSGFGNGSGLRTSEAVDLAVGWTSVRRFGRVIRLISEIAKFPMP